MVPDQAALLRLYLDGSRRWRGRPAYRAVVEAARALGLAGASVFLVDLSYGLQRRVHDSHSDYGFIDVPVVVEVVDAPDRLDDLLRELGPLLDEGFATIEPVRVVRHSHHERPRSDTGG